MKLLHSLVLNTITTLAAIAPLQVLAQQPLSPDARQLLNCLSSYPQTSTEGNHPVTRYEFAVGLEACLNEVSSPLRQGNFATKTELKQLIQRQQGLNQELRQLRDRVDASDPVPSAK